MISLEEKRFKCQQSGHCCCDPKIIVTLTFRDLFRLYSALDNDFRILLQKISFYTLKESSPSLQKQMVLKPIQTSQGTAIPGLRKKKEICVFYHLPNCIIYPSRPLSCRNYPLAFVKEEKQLICTWAKNSQKTCPGIGKGSPLSLQYIEQLGKRSFNEIEKHNQIVREINVEADSNRPLTAREALWILVTYGESELK
ncbi:MAG: YkgJ family cysteine cluster protein [Promethearchaeota archaeon]